MSVPLERFFYSEPDEGNGLTESQSDSGKRRFIEKLVLVLLSFYLLADTINGFLVLSIGLPSLASVAYKQVILLLVLVYAFLFEPKRCFWCFFLLSVIFLWALLRFLLVDNVHFSSAFQEILKVAYPFILALVISRFHLLSEKSLQFAVWLVIAILMFNIVSTFLGLGYSTYKGDTFGAKGFFYAANSLSGILVIAASVSLVPLYRRSLLAFLMMALFLLILATLIGTKGGILGVFLVAGLVVLFHMDAKGFLLFLLAGMAIAIIVLILGEQLTNNTIVQRIIYFYDTGGIQRALFSGRVEKMNVLLPLLSQQSIAELLLGLDKVSMTNVGVTRVEFDWFDMQIYFGSVFTLATYWAYIVVFAKFLTFDKNGVVMSAIIAFLVLFVISSIAGHIIFNASVTPLLGLLMASAFKLSNTISLPRKDAI